MKFYHYTPENRLPELLESQAINLAFKSVNSNTEKAVAWVSTNPEWENTATKNAIDSIGKIRRLTFQEQVELFGCARIQIKPTYKLHEWKKITKLANIQFNIVNQLEILGRKMGGKPKEWYGSLKPIPIDAWVSIEIFQNGNWVELINFENGTISGIESRFFKFDITNS